MSYIHGYSRRETERLQDQSYILEDLLHQGTRYGKNEKILEAGCGVGAQSRILGLNNPGSQITSIDISPESLRKALATIESEQIKNIIFEEQDLLKMTYLNESFDHVFVCFVLEHLSDPCSALDELGRVLKGGGSITIIEGDHGSCFWHPETESSRKVWTAFIRAQAILGHDGLIGRRLYPLLRECGYQVEFVAPKWIYADNSNPVLLDGVVNKIIVPMVESGKKQILDSGLLSSEIWDKGISELKNVGSTRSGTFFYTWFKAVARKSQAIS